MTESQAGRWTSPDAYVVALARKRTFRRSKRPGARTEPESPHLMLSTLPFVILLAFLGVIMVAIIVAAYPGSQPAVQPPRFAEHQELGVARKGWFQEAQKEFHR